MKKVINVTPLNDYKLKLIFDNNVSKIFDVKPYMDCGIFKELNDTKYFEKVRVSLDSIQWPNGQDFDPDHLYIESQIDSPQK